jgi:N utilization substance protein B
VTRRRDARRLAVNLLYQADVGGRDALDVLAERREVGDRIPAFTEDLVRGVTEHRDELDSVIGARSGDWPVDRMAAVDRTLLRLGAYEVLYRDDVPPGAAIDEAVGAAKELSTAESGAFVNGILGRIARDHAETG